jgi:Predicted membrane protein (DUF2306)
MAPPPSNFEEYAAIPDVENGSKYATEQQQFGKKGTEEEIPPTVTNKEPDTYNLSFVFSLLSGTVWFSMFLWGIWIATFYSLAIANRNWHNFNIIFPDMWVDEYPVASIAISIHLIGAVFMSLAGAFQLVKYIRKHYAVFHRWVGRLYVAASIIASCGGLVFIFNKGSYGGREADVAFAMADWCSSLTRAVTVDGRPTLRSRYTVVWYLHLLLCGDCKGLLHPQTVGVAIICLVFGRLDLSS